MSNQKPPTPPSWSEFFALDATTDVPADFMTEEDRNQHGTWFAGQVARGLAEADAPADESISNDQAKASWDEKRAQLAARIEGQQE